MGGVLQEIHLSYDPGKAVASGLTPGLLSQQIQENHLLEPLGDLRAGALRTPLLLDAYLESIQDIREIILPLGQGQPVRLEDLGTVLWDVRERESINRIDGQEGLTLALFPSAEGNPLEISQGIPELLEHSSDQGWVSGILLDQGERVQASLIQILLALAVGIIVLAILFYLIYRRMVLIALFTAFFLVSVYLTISLLSFLGVTISTEVLAGIALGIGLIADNGILGLESIRDKGNMIEGKASQRDLRSSLLASNITTVIALLPLLIVDRILPSLTPVFQSLITILVISLVLVLVFFPFIVQERWAKPKVELQAPEWQGFWSKKMIGRPLLMLITMVPLAFLLFLPKSFAQSPNPGVLFAKAEFPSGQDLQRVDRNIPAYLEALQQLPVLTKVESTSRDESVSLTFTYDPDTHSALEVKNTVNELSGMLGEGSLIFIESAFEDRLQIELGVYGEDLELIHSKAREALDALSKEEWALGGVYHFKPNPSSLVLIPKRDTTAAGLLPPRGASERLKWSIQGPVTDKIFIQGKETDIRIFAQDGQAWTKQDLQQVFFTTEAGPVSLDSILEVSEVEDFIRITRRGGQRVALFSLETQKMDLFQLEQLIRETLRTVELPQGYSIQLSPKIFQFQEDLQTLLWVFLAAVFLIYCVLAAQKENLSQPLLVLLMIPGSLLLPLAYFWFKGFLDPAGIVGLIMITGAVINNGIVVLESYPDIQSGLSERFRSLLLTTATTAIGTLPIILLGPKEDSFEKTLAITILLGILGSLVMALVFLPFLQPKGENPEDPLAQDRG
jgi:multidrug efflux pump subunit AcrB